MNRVMLLFLYEHRSGHDAMDRVMLFLIYMSTTVPALKQQELCFTKLCRLPLAARMYRCSRMDTSRDRV